MVTSNGDPPSHVSLAKKSRGCGASIMQPAPLSIPRLARATWHPPTSTLDRGEHVEVPRTRRGKILSRIQYQCRQLTWHLLSYISVAASSTFRLSHARPRSDPRLYGREGPDGTGRAVSPRRFACRSSRHASADRGHHTLLDRPPGQVPSQVLASR